MTEVATAQQYDWDCAMMDIAHSVARLSPDPRTKVGCVVLSPCKGKMAFGFNRFPSRIPNLKDIWNNRDPQSSDLCKYDAVIHAEKVAIKNVAGGVHGWTLYVTAHPCAQCASFIVDEYIRRVVYCADLSTSHVSLAPEKARFIFELAGVQVDRLTKE